MPLLRGSLARILYDIRMLRRRLEVLEARLERSAERRGIGSDVARQYHNALRHVRYVARVLEVLEIKLESILALKAVTQDLAVVRETLRELSRRVRSLPEVSAILDELSDRVSDVMVGMPVDVGDRMPAVYTEAAKKILEEAEKLIGAGDKAS